MIIKLMYEKYNDIGVYFKITNSYCFVPYNVPDKCLKVMKSELKSFIPVIKTTIFQSKCLGRLIIGNKKGVILPFETDVNEFNKIKNSLPDDIVVKRCSEKFSALGNCIMSNDFNALVHPEISSRTEELIEDTMGVEIFKLCLGSEKLVGSYCIFNNNGGLVHPSVSIEDQDEISSLLEIPLLVGTVNCGDYRLSSGIIANDDLGFCGYRTTQSELYVMETAFRKKS